MEDGEFGVGSAIPLYPDAADRQDERPEAGSPGDRVDVDVLLRTRQLGSAQATDREAGTRKRVPLDQRSRQAQDAAQHAHLVLVELAQGLEHQSLLDHLP